MPQLFIPLSPLQQQQQQQLQWHAPSSSSTSTARSPPPASAYEDISSDAAEVDSESDCQQDVDDNDRAIDCIIEELEEKEETA